MKFPHTICTVSLCLLLLAPLPAAVKTENRTKVDFAGVMGGMMRFFGGKAAKDGVVSSTAVKGNRLMTVTDKTGQLIDLDEEKVYEIDFDKKRYKIKTFEEMREEMRKAAEEMAKAQPAPQQTAEQRQKAPEVEVSVDVRETGQHKTINTFDCREVVVEVTTHEKGKTLESSGGMVLSTNMWLGPELPGAGELADFYRRYAEKLNLFSAMGLPSAQMTMAENMYPMMKDAVKKFQEVDMKGSPILTVMTFETVASEEQRRQAQQQPAQEEQNIGSIGGLLGGLGRKMARKKESEEQPSQPGRAKLMTTTSELLSATASVSDADVSISPEFKERK